MSEIKRNSLPERELFVYPGTDLQRLPGIVEKRYYLIDYVVTERAVCKVNKVTCRAALLGRNDYEEGFEVAIIAPMKYYIAKFRILFNTHAQSPENIFVARPLFAKIIHGINGRGQLFFVGFRF